MESRSFNIHVQLLISRIYALFLVILNMNAFSSTRILKEDMLQVSPELYGDNNPRLFTYWTVCVLSTFLKKSFYFIYQ